MKNTNTMSLGLIGLLILPLTLMSCNNAKDRPETIDSKIEANLVEVSALHDISSEIKKAYFYKESADSEVTAADKTAQMKADADVIRVLEMVKNKEQKEILKTHMEKGLVGFMILADEVKIYKVMTKTKARVDQKANAAINMTEIKKLKKISLEKNKMSAAEIDLKESGDEIQYIEIASLKVKQSGILENKKTQYYDEKTSLLTVADRPLDVSTHLLLEPQEEEKAEKKKD